jgi:hypothetical protein
MLGLIFYAATGVMAGALVICYDPHLRKYGTPAGAMILCTAFGPLALGAVLLGILGAELSKRVSA